MACTLSNKCAKIFLNGQFYFNLSSKTWSHVFGTQCRTLVLVNAYKWAKFQLSSCFCFIDTVGVPK